MKQLLIAILLVPGVAGFGAVWYGMTADPARTGWYLTAAAGRPVRLVRCTHGTNWSEYRVVQAVSGRPLRLVHLHSWPRFDGDVPAVRWQFSRGRHGLDSGGFRVSLRRMKESEFVFAAMFEQLPQLTFIGPGPDRPLLLTVKRTQQGLRFLLRDGYHAKEEVLRSGAWSAVVPRVRDPEQSAMYDGLGFAVALQQGTRHWRAVFDIERSPVSWGGLLLYTAGSSKPVRLQHFEIIEQGKVQGAGSGYRSVQGFRLLGPVIAWRLFPLRGAPFFVVQRKTGGWYGPRGERWQVHFSHGVVRFTAPAGGEVRFKLGG